MIASFVQNTSMTLKDVMETTLPQFDCLLEGISKNNKEMKEGSVKKGDANDFVSYLQNNGGTI